jgi:hypothetical protein
MQYLSADSSYPPTNEVIMKILRGIFLSLTMILFPLTAISQEVVKQALSDVELNYTYSDGGAVIVTIKNGKLGYRWTAGIFKGVEVTGRTYFSRKLADSMYLVSWHDAENKNFVTLVFDLNRMIEYGAGLLSYSKPDESAHFDEAKINSVKWLK